MREVDLPAMEEFEPFPVHTFVPKRETGVDRFLAKYREFDGSDVVISIFDTGIDPSAPGLQITTRGKPKILDLIDASGSGDVDTSLVQTGTEFPGLSGRQLRVPGHWENPSGKWHVGSKAIHELFPSSLLNRLQTSYTDKSWNPFHHPAVVKANTDLADFDAKHGKDKLTQLSLKLQREELQSRIDLLSNPGNKTTNPGPVYDCIVFHDGEIWKAAIDTTETGDFSKATIMSPYIYDHQYARFGEDDQMCYSINIYNDGNILSIVTSSGSHGTHVASIAAGFFPDEPEKNGIAPGAQIIGVKISDTRLSTLTTAPSLIRAANEAAKLRVDVVNFSYSKASHWVDKGKVIDQFRTLVEKYNITFVSGASNNGPALSTIGCPANIAFIIGVGAMVSPDMMAGEYSMVKRKSSTHYTWSSRGPVVDGHLGVSVSAPGGAITSVPRWMLKKEQLMNGTSMSCPSVSGAIALLISALKAEGIPHTPAMVKRSLENTTLPLPGSDEFSNGHGVVQIDKAYEYIRQNWINQSSAMTVDFQVTISAGGKTLRGVYLREVHETSKPSNHSIEVEPIFPKSAGAAQKLSLDLHLALVGSESWVHTPKHLVLHNSARQFSIKVDPTGLPPGAHYAEVCAYDVSRCFQGALFRVPVTVLIPIQMSQDHPGVFVSEEIDFQRISVHRFFLPVPGDVTWAEIELMSKNEEAPSRVTVHTIQLPPLMSFSTKETRHTVKIKPNGSSTIIVPLTGGYVMELCCSQYWSDLSDAKMSLKVTYHSLHSDTPNIKFHCGESWARMDVRCNYRQEEILPELKFTHYVIVKRPHEYLIQSLGERDTLLSGEHLHELQLAYSFHVVNGGSEVRPICSLLNKFLFESPFTGQFWMLYNTQKKLICCGDAFCHKYSSKLDRGDYVVKLQVCHDKQTVLEGLRDLVLLLEVKLTSTIGVNLYPTMADALNASNKWHSKKLSPNDTVSIFLTTLFEEKLPRNYQSGDYMKGKLTLCRADNVKKEVYYPVHYVLIEKPKKTSSKSSTSTSSSSFSTATGAQEYDKKLKDLELQLMMLKKEVFDTREMISRVGVTTPTLMISKLENDLDFLMARLSCCVDDKSCQYNPVVSSLVTKVYKQVNTQEILAYCGTKLDLSDGASNKQSQMEKARKILIDCLMSEGIVIARDISRNEETTPVVAYIGRLEEIYITLHQLLDAKDCQLRSFRIHYARAMRYNGIVAKLLEEEANDLGPSKERDIELVRIFDGFGWVHYGKAVRRWLPRNYPKNFQPF